MLIHRKLGSMLGAAMFLFCLALGCASAPQEPEETEKEIVVRTRRLGDKLARSFEPLLRLKSDAAVSAYLTKVANILVLSNSSLTQNTPVVSIIKQASGRSTSYALPGNRLYISAGALRVTQLDAEVAALMSIQLGHLQLGHLISRMEKEEAARTSGAPDWVGEQGVFAFGENELVSALDAGLKIMRNAGFDTRGMTGLLSRFAEAPLSAPYPKEMLERMVDRVHRYASRNVPLRNPIVRSQEFVAIQQRLKSL